MAERRHRVVVVGGGFGGLTATQALADADLFHTLSKQDRVQLLVDVGCGTTQR
jgi:NADH dehydrogenase FAD-containing subunit